MKSDWCAPHIHTLTHSHTRTRTRSLQRFNALKSSAAYQFRDTKTRYHILITTSSSQHGEKILLRSSYTVCGWLDDQNIRKKGKKERKKIYTYNIYYIKIDYQFIFVFWRTFMRWQMVCSYFRKLQCNGETLTLLISYRVHRAHTLLIDVISYSNNDTAFSRSLALSLPIHTRIMLEYVSVSLVAHIHRWERIEHAIWCTGARVL